MMSVERKNQIMAMSLFILSEIMAVLIVGLLYTYSINRNMRIIGVTTVILNGHGMVLSRGLPGYEFFTKKHINLGLQFCLLMAGISGIAIMMNDRKREMLTHIYMSYLALSLYFLQIIVFVFLYQKREFILVISYNFLGIIILQLSIVLSCIHLQDNVLRDNGGDMTVICMVVYGVLINAIVLNTYIEWHFDEPINKE